MMDAQKFSVRGHVLGAKLQHRLEAICESAEVDQKSRDVANWIRKSITIEARNRETDGVVLAAVVQGVMIIDGESLYIGITAPDSDQWSIVITSDGAGIPQLQSNSLEQHRRYSIERISF